MCLGRTDTERSKSPQAIDIIKIIVLTKEILRCMLIYEVLPLDVSSTAKQHERFAMLPVSFSKVKSNALAASASLAALVALAALAAVAAFSTI